MSNTPNEPEFVEFEEDDVLTTPIHAPDQDRTEQARREQAPTKSKSRFGTYTISAVLLVASAFLGYQIWKNKAASYSSSFGIEQMIVAPAPAAISALPAVSAPVVVQDSPEKIALIELQQQVAQLGQANKQLLNALRSKGYINVVSDASSMDAMGVMTAMGVNEVSLDNLKPYPTPIKPATPVRVIVKPAPKVSEPKPSNQVLSVDLWGGRPSVVVGTGVPGDKRVMVLQQGDSYNGNTLKSVNMKEQRVTFGVNGGRDVSLGVTGAQ